MMEDNVREKECICVCVCVCVCVCDWVTLLYSRQLIEYCKPTIMEKKFLKIKKKIDHDDR